MMRAAGRWLKQNWFACLTLLIAGIGAYTGTAAYLQQQSTSITLAPGIPATIYRPDGVKGYQLDPVVAVTNESGHPVTLTSGEITSKGSGSGSVDCVRPGVDPTQLGKLSEALQTHAFRTATFYSARHGNGDGA